MTFFRLPDFEGGMKVLFTRVEEFDIQRTGIIVFSIDISTSTEFRAWMRHSLFIMVH